MCSLNMLRFLLLCININLVFKMHFWNASYLFTCSLDKNQICQLLSFHSSFAFFFLLTKHNSKLFMFPVSNVMWLKLGFFSWKLRVFFTFIFPLLFVLVHVYKLCIRKVNRNVTNKTFQCQDSLKKISS